MRQPITLPAAWLSEGHGLRAARGRDRNFQRALFAACRPDAVFIDRLPRVQRDAFLDSQFSLQDTHYRRFFAGADVLIVTRQGTPVGRLIVHRSAKEWRLVDIGLMPDARGQGLGAALVGAVQAACVAARVDCLHLQVEAGNRARRLYERLGFVATGDGGAFAEMTWRASRQLKTAS